MSIRFGYWPPSPRQNEFLRARQFEQLYGGAKRGGKSVAISMKAVLLSVSYPGNRGGLFRQDLTDLRDSLLVTFMRVCPRHLILEHHQTYKRIVIDTGGEPSTILYGGLGDTHDVESAKGKEFGWFAIDEPSEVDPEAYRMLLAQLCWTLPDGTRPPYMAILGSNPEPGWVEEKYRDLIEQTNDVRSSATSPDGNKIFIRALPKDNPGLPPGWENSLRLDSPAAWVKKYLEGSWEVSEGQVFREFDRTTHIIECPTPAFLSKLKLVASIDHATTGITCMCVDGIDPDGNIFALGSYYEKNRLISEHARGMQALMDYWVDACGLRVTAQRDASDPSVYPAVKAFDYVLIDPSTQAKTLQNRNEMWSVQDEYRRNGIPTQPSWNAIEAGVNLLQEYLHAKPAHIHPMTQQRGSPSFFIVRGSNESGVREMIGWRKMLNDSGMPKYIGPDHWIDNQRYIAMSRPEPPRFTSADLTMSSYRDGTSIEQIAARDLARFDKKFRSAPGVPGYSDGSQWFAGGSGNSNEWWSRRDWS